MKKLVTLAVSAAMSVALLGLPTPPAGAHDGGAHSCVSKHEWGHVQRGMKKWRVHRILDVRGRFVDGFAGGYTRQYKACDWNSDAGVKLFISYSGSTRRVVEKRAVVFDTPKCVSRAEYRAVKNGWTRARVARIFNVGGYPTATVKPYRARFYKDCWRSKPQWNKVSVVYRYRNGAWRVVDKTKQFWHV